MRPPTRPAPGTTIDNDGQLMRFDGVIWAAIEGFGGFLRCETCGHVIDLDDDMDVRTYMRTGWPEHCGHTMRWWTARQVVAQEVPDLEGRHR